MNKEEEATLAEARKKSATLRNTALLKKEVQPEVTRVVDELIKEAQPGLDLKKLEEEKSFNSLRYMNGEALVCQWTENPARTTFHTQISTTKRPELEVKGKGWNRYNTNHLIMKKDVYKRDVRTDTPKHAIITIYGENGDPFASVKTQFAELKATAEWKYEFGEHKRLNVPEYVQFVTSVTYYFPREKRSPDFEQDGKLRSQKISDARKVKGAFKESGLVHLKLGAKESNASNGHYLKSPKIRRKLEFAEPLVISEPGSPPRPNELDDRLSAEKINSSDGSYKTIQYSEGKSGSFSAREFDAKGREYRRAKGKAGIEIEAKQVDFKVGAQPKPRKPSELHKRPALREKALDNDMKIDALPDHSSQGSHNAESAPDDGRENWLEYVNKNNPGPSPDDKLSR